MERFDNLVDVETVRENISMTIPDSIIEYLKTVDCEYVYTRLDTIVTRLGVVRDKMFELQFKVVDGNWMVRDVSYTSVGGSGDGWEVESSNMFNLPSKTTSTDIVERMYEYQLKGSL